MRVLLTGHKGFIGSHLHQRLIDREMEVIGIDLKDGWDRDGINNSQDLLNCELPSGMDLIIHLAGKSGVRESMEDPAAYWRNNVEVTRRIFERYTRTRILYASSSSMYEPELNPYAASKFIIEEAAVKHPNNLGMRFHTVYSDNPREGMFLQKLFDDELEYVTTHRRDFIHIDDLCDAIEVLIDNEIGGVTDIGTGDPVKISELVKDKKLPVRLSTPNEREFTCADITNLRELGWIPQHDVRDLVYDQTNSANRNKVPV
jgi:nucleoside-diphosphate-sugar epimerase